MTNTKFHNTENGPKPCSADVRDCPVGGSHFNNKEEAQEAYEKSMVKEKGMFGLFKKSNPYTNHVQKADKLIKKLENDFKARDERQFKDTTYQQLLKEVSAEELKEMSELEVNNREAGIGFLRSEDSDDKVIGLTYSADFKAEEEWGLAAISKRLSNGESKPEDITYLEKDGKGVLVIAGEDRSHGYRSDERKEERIETALERFKNYRSYDDMKSSWKYNRMKVSELREMLKGKVKPLPTKRDDLVNAAVKLEKGEQKDSIKPPQGEFQRGDFLAIVSDNPAMIATMKKVKDSNDNGTLRLGSSNNPFSNGALFYDERDVSRKSKEQEVRSNVAKKAADEYIEPTRTKLNTNGNLYALSSNADSDIKDVRESKFFINYSPKANLKNGKHQIFGWFDKDDLEKIANEDFSPYYENEEKRK